jgi:hypothetical protein
MSTVKPQQPTNFNVIILLFGIALLTGGIVSKQYHESKDSKRTKFEKTNIDKIDDYDVVYRSLVHTDSEHNIPQSAIKRVGDIHFFKIKDGNKGQYVPYPITSVTKVVSKIEVTTADGKKILIDKFNFTKDITDADVGTSIDIEYDINDLTNTSMAVEGLTSSQLFSSWSMIIIGIGFIIIYILIFLKVI